MTVTGVLLPDNRLLLQPGFLTTETLYAAEDPESDLVVELFDDGGRPLLRFRLPVSPLAADGAVAEQAVLGKVPFPADTRRLRFYRDDVPIHELEVPAGKPEVSLEWDPPEVVEGRHVVSWTGAHPDGLELHYILGYSTNGGHTWQPLTLPTPETQREVDFATLPGGRGRLGVFATDGANTVLAESSSFRVPAKGCLATILAPEDGARVEPGEPLWLEGQGLYLEERRLELERVRWTSSLDGELGREPALAVRLSPGRHRITFSAGSGRLRSETQITVEVAGAPRRVRR